MLPLTALRLQPGRGLRVVGTFEAIDQAFIIAKATPFEKSESNALIKTMSSSIARERIDKHPETERSSKQRVRASAIIFVP